MSNTSRRVFDWYEIVDRAEPLEQGDIVVSLPVSFPEYPEETVEGTVVDSEGVISDYIVLTQSCDLIFAKVDNILLCPISTLSDHIEDNYPGAKKEAKINHANRVRVGEVIGWHLLNRCELPGSPMAYHVVDLKNPIALPVAYVVHHVQEQPTRLRLLPPYREQLSQAFARVFMRVGLPSDIPEFTSAIF